MDTMTRSGACVWLQPLKQVQQPRPKGAQRHHDASRAFYLRGVVPTEDKDFVKVEPNHGQDAEGQYNGAFGGARAHLEMNAGVL